MEVESPMSKDATPLDGATKEEWAPTMSGNTTAYRPQFRNGAWIDGALHWTKWQDIPTRDGKGVCGAAYPAFEGGMLKTIGLFGYEQAQALAWTCAAAAAGEPTTIETRLIAFEFKYEMKARELVGKEIACSTIQP